jgi:uncharacterized C2H2 Zn-finger protein
MTDIMPCFVPGCREDPWHRFPADPDLKMKWHLAIQREGPSLTLYKTSKICHNHFKQKDFRDTLTQRRLKPDAVPSVFPPLTQPQPHFDNKQMARSLSRPRRIYSPPRKVDVFDVGAASMRQSNAKANYSRVRTVATGLQDPAQAYRADQMTCEGSCGTLHSEVNIAPTGDSFDNADEGIKEEPLSMEPSELVEVQIKDEMAENESTQMVSVDSQFQAIWKKEDSEVEEIDEDPAYQLEEEDPVNQMIDEEDLEDQTIEGDPIGQYAVGLLQRQAMWKKQLKEVKAATCIHKKCSISWNTLPAIRHHHKICTGLVHQGYTTCTECSLKFQTFCSLMRHMNAAHPNRNPAAWEKAEENASGTKNASSSQVKSNTNYVKMHANAPSDLSMKSVDQILNISDPLAGRPADGTPISGQELSEKILAESRMLYSGRPRGRPRKNQIIPGNPQFQTIWKKGELEEPEVHVIGDPIATGPIQSQVRRPPDGQLNEITGKELSEKKLAESRMLYSGRPRGRPRQKLIISGDPQFQTIWKKGELEEPEVHVIGDRIATGPTQSQGEKVEQRESGASDVPDGRLSMMNRERKQQFDEVREDCAEMLQPPMPKQYKREAGRRQSTINLMVRAAVDKQLAKAKLVMSIEESVKCGKCGQVCKNKAHFLAHVAVTHGGVARVRGKSQLFTKEEEEVAVRVAFMYSDRVSCYRCQIKTFGTRSGLKNHLRTCGSTKKDISVGFLII